MRKRLTKFIIAGTAIAVLFVTGSAMAALSGTVKANVNVAGGLLSLTPPPGDETLAGVTLDGTNQLGVAAGDIGVWKVVNPRGNNLGWELTMGASDFEMVGNPAETIPKAGFDITAVNYIQESGTGTNVTPGTGSLGAGVTVLTSATGPGNGRGVSRVTPNVNLDVPAETLIGDYASTVTGTLASF